MPKKKPEARFLTGLLYDAVANTNKTNKSRILKFYYFCWRHGIKTTKRDYSLITEEEFREKYKIQDSKWNWLRSWETSKEYKQLELLWIEGQMVDDVLKIYHVVKQKALQGDEKAIKTFLQLQDEIRKLRKLEQVQIELPLEETTEQENEENDDDIELTLD